MRQECQVMLPSAELCGKPSVDSVPDPGCDDGRFWLCAQHWDELQIAYNEDDGFYSYEFPVDEDDDVA